MTELIKVGISHGDINGVSYEILLKTFSDNRLTELFTPYIYGSSKSASYHRKVLNCEPVQFNIISTTAEALPERINLINCIKEEVRIELGQPTAEAGESAFCALKRATEDMLSGKVDVLVTLPINKDTIQNEAFNFPGHTEYLESRFAVNNDKALMIMTSETLKVALVTTHLPIAKISEAITKEAILEKIATLNFSLQRDFGIQMPRIAVLGLNPHAGENGLLGTEEKELINPAIKMAQDAGVLCSGAYAADGFFGTGHYRDFDAILAMYHDQGLIPFKTLSMGKGVNFTAGLPIVRTSPAHGTAYDIVGKNIASEESFLQAIYSAIDIYKNRKFYDEARLNPLKKMFFDKGKDDVRLDLTKENGE